MVRVRPFTAGLVIPFCGFYTTQVGFSPIYASFVIAYTLFALLVLYKGKFYGRGLAVSTVTLIVYFMLTQVGRADTNVLTNIVISVTSAFVSYNVLVTSEKAEILRLVKLLLWLSIVLLSVEALYRFANPIVQQGSGETTFYAYKLNSLMYPDSNYVGLFIVVLFFLACYSSQYDSGKWHLEKIALFTLAVLTLSRGSIATIVAIYTIWVFKEYKIMYLVGTIIFVFGIYAAMKILSIDQSFAVRFIVVNLFIEHVMITDWDHILFGVGFGRTADYIGIGGHNIFITFLMETGIIGSLLLFSFWWYLVEFSRGAALIVFLPFLVNGQTLVSHAAPYLYVSAATIAVLSRYHRKDLNCRRSRSILAST